MPAWAAAASFRLLSLGRLAFACCSEELAPWLLLTPSHPFKLAILVIDDHWKELQPALEAVLPDILLIYEPDGHSGLATLRRRDDVDCILLDLRMPADFGEVVEERVGLQILKRIVSEFPLIPVVMHTTIDDDPELVQEARQLGAYWYIAKSSSAQALLHRVSAALKHRQNLLHAASPGPDSGRETRVVGEAAIISSVENLLSKVAPTSATVLIQGETGTGKELAARAILRMSHRAKRPFHIVDCANLNPDVLQAELWGSVPGAFTGAIDRQGAFEAADGGTVFLDEIGEIPRDEQSSLLRVLEYKEIKRLGENKYRHVDVRILAATNRDLARMVQQGDFRDDLFERLCVFNIHLPPLRDIPEDISGLVEHFLAKHSPEGVGPPSVAPEAMDLLVSYPWPRNIRQLENAVRRALILHDGQEIGPDLFDLPPVTPRARSLEEPAPDLEALLRQLGLSEFAKSKGKDALKELLLAAVRKHGGIKEAGESLGLFHEGREDKDYDLLRVWCRRLGIRTRRIV